MLMCNQRTKNHWYNVSTWLKTLKKDFIGDVSFISVEEEISLFIILSIKPQGTWQDMMNPQISLIWYHGIYTSHKHISVAYD